MLRQAFNAITRIHSRAAQIKRLGSPDTFTPCRLTPSNYFRFLEGPSHTVIRGREFIIPIDSTNGLFVPRRGDKIIDPVYGTLTIDEVIEMVDLGGAIMGLRVRSE